MPNETLIANLETAFAKLSGHDDASHDVHHARRVMANALSIADREEGADRDILIAAAYLHDIVNLPKNSPDRARASTLSAEAARPILAELGFTVGAIDVACHAIVAHSFSANVEPTTLEARILQDADRLESLGAIGIARTFFIAGKLGSALFEADDPFAANRPLDDKRFAVDHFEVKLLRLPETMRTDGGRLIAQQRADMMRGFLAALGDELGYQSIW